MIQQTRRKRIYYYEIDRETCDNGIPNYIYDKHFDYFLSAMSNRVFELNDNVLYVVSGDQTYYHLTPQETTFIILSARPRPQRLLNHFDPGHA